MARDSVRTMAPLGLKEALSDRIDDLSDAVVALAEINSGSYSPNGVNECGERLADFLEPLAPDSLEAISVPPTPVVDVQDVASNRDVGRALRAVKRSDAPFRVCLFGHLDTVFEADDPFQEVHRHDTRLHGPGVADCKGGLVLAVEVLRYLERADWAADIGWEFLVVPDEEVGSVGSKPLLAEAARSNHLGLGFEPALPTGGIAAARRGSLNVHTVVSGVAAHAGRAHSEGRSAIRGLAEIIQRLEDCNERPGVTVNCGRMAGGERSMWCPTSPSAATTSVSPRARTENGFTLSLMQPPPTTVLMWNSYGHRNGLRSSALKSWNRSSQM